MKDDDFKYIQEMDAFICDKYEELVKKKEEDTDD